MNHAHVCVYIFGKVQRHAGDWWWVYKNHEGYDKHKPYHLSRRLEIRKSNKIYNN